MENREELVAKALRLSQLIGCDCCTGDAYHDTDSCPVDEDGWKDHSYWGDCSKNEDRVTLIARVAIAALESA